MCGKQLFAGLHNSRRLRRGEWKDVRNSFPRVAGESVAGA